MIESKLHTSSELSSADAVDQLVLERAIASEAQTIDETAAFPQSSITRLADAGLLVWPLQHEPDNAALYDQLVWVGRASLTVGRLFEGHVNGAALISAYGNAQNRAITLAEANRGHITGVWNAQRGKGLIAEHSDGGWILSGTKIFCSGAGSIRHPIVTASVSKTSDVLMVMPDMESAKAKVDLSAWRPSGMRGTATGTVSFDRHFVPHEAVIGQPGDYYRSPLFSGGAWRVLSVQLGGLQRIVELHAQRLIEWNRFDDTLTRSRFAAASLNLELARLLATEASRRAGNIKDDAETINAYVDGARASFETLALTIIENTRRNIGLSTFIWPDPLDLVIRDLETYLRQPFLDASRDNAAKYLLHRKGSFGL